MATIRACAKLGDDSTNFYTQKRDEKRDEKGEEESINVRQQQRAGSTPNRGNRLRRRGGKVEWRESGPAVYIPKRNGKAKKKKQPKHYVNFKKLLPLQHFLVRPCEINYKYVG